jgi:SAM-dependent methyltransferase
LPLWRGIQAQPGVAEAPPFRLCWDNRGFLRQSTEPEIREAVLAAYASDHYRFITPPPGESLWANRLGDRKIAAACEFLGPLDGLKVLEIGAGGRYVADRLLGRFDIDEYVAIDPAIRSESTAGRLSFVRDYYPSPRLAGRSFDVVLSFSCLEHVADPVDFLEHINRSLAKRGRAFLTFPDVERQFRVGDLNVLLHEHMSYLDSHSAVQLAILAGLRPVGQSSENDLFAYVLEKVPSASPGPKRSRLCGLLDTFAGSLERSGEAISRSLERGERVAFHGANNGLNIVLHLAKIDTWDSIFVFDGDASKAGNFLPACPKPISAATDPTYREVDQVFVAATSFFDEIKRQLVADGVVPPERISPLFDAA